MTTITYQELDEIKQLINALDEVGMAWIAVDVLVTDSNGQTLGVLSKDALGEDQGYGLDVSYAGKVGRFSVA